MPKTLYDLIRARYPMPEWAVFAEIPTQRGFNAKGYCDAVACNLWESRGYAIHGFEIKSSRSDWLRELKDPVKAEATIQYCDFWWLVTEAEIVREGELPVGWGWLERGGDRFHVRVVAKKRDPVEPSRGWYFKLLHRAIQEVSAIESAASEIPDDERFQESYRRGRADAETAAAKRLLTLEQEIERYRAERSSFEKDTGIRTSDYARGDVIKRVRYLANLDNWLGVKCRVAREREAAVKFLASTSEFRDEVESTSPDGASQNTSVPAPE